MHQSVRLICPGVALEIAAVLGCSLSQMLFCVTYSRAATLATPLFATRCGDMLAIMHIQDIVHAQNLQNLAANPSKLDGLEFAALVVRPQRDGGVSITPYPALAQQHATRVESVTFMPWPATKRQR